MRYAYSCILLRRSQCMRVDNLGPRIHIDAWMSIQIYSQVTL